jgi:cytoskeletal protein CcmA (bactofilin family)
MLGGKVTKKNVVNAFGETVVANRINNGCIITGHLFSDTDFRIDGKINGNVTCTSKVVIGPTGEVHGDIDCTDLTMEGRVFGQLRVAGTLYFRKTAFFEGQVKFIKLIVEEGADINADLTRIELPASEHPHSLEQAASSEEA